MRTVRLQTAVQGARWVLLRLLISGGGAGFLVGLASLGMVLTTQPEWVNLIFEPFSLLFLPGIAVAIAWTALQGHLQKHVKTLADNHDFSTSFVVLCTLLFYFAVLYWLLLRRGRMASRTIAAGSR